MKDIINQLVSEQVLGWSRSVRKNNPEGHHYYADYWVDVDGRQKKPVEFWSPATDIKAAHAVANHVIGMRFVGSMEWVIKGNEVVVKLDGEPACYSSSLPLAICIAALKSVGIDLPSTYHELK